jgi:hypothetical protein
MPVRGPVVDPTANTVTVELEHFSVYAVLKTRSAEAWNEFFGDVPLLCAPPGSATAAAFDLAFLTDVSGSMAWNDPDRLRVAGAKALVDTMHDTDRVAVVGFDIIAMTFAPLTPLDTPQHRADIHAAIDQTGAADWGTDISAAVQRAIEILAPAGGPERARAAVLLTDGQSGYDSALTTQAAEAGIVIHTVGLGDGVNAELLQGIADGTGGTYRHLTSADQLVDVYTALAADFVETGADFDGDGLTDCEERNGMFVPSRLLVPWLFDYSGGRFIRSDWRNPDTDGDGRSDGEELVRRRLADDPDVNATYPFLAAGGISSYFVVDSDPNKFDTDGDGLDDGREVTVCDPEGPPECDGWPFLRGPSDPLKPDTDGDGATDWAEFVSGGSPGVPDRWWYAAAGLDIPAFTLIQPDRYGHGPALLGGWLRLDSDGDGVRAPIRYIGFNPLTITYDDDDNCVFNCDPVINAANGRGTDNGSGICIRGWFGSCLTLEDQQRRVIRDARLWLGVFDRNGYLTESFQADQAAAACVAYHAFPAECVYDTISDAIGDLNDDHDVTPALLGFVTTNAVKRTLPDGRPIVGQAIVESIAIHLAQRFYNPIAQPDDEDVEHMVRECMQGPAWQVVGFLNGLHPCEVMPIFAPGGDVPEAADHKADALAEHPEWVELIYQTETDLRNRPNPLLPGWYNGTPECDPDARAAANAARTDGVRVDCDEFPYRSTHLSGPGASLRLISEIDNGLEGEGGYLGRFYQRCAEPVKVERQPYLVVPMAAAGAPATMWSCGAGG